MADLAEIADLIDEAFPAQGLKLIAEGANHNRIRRLLSPLRRALYHQQAIRYEMVIDACPAIQCGHTPEEIAERLLRFYTP